MKTTYTAEAQSWMALARSHYKKSTIMENTIASLKAELITLGLKEIDALTGGKVHVFVVPGEFIDGKNKKVLRTYSTYTSGYTRRNHWGYMGECLVTINPVVRTPKDQEYQDMARNSGDTRKQYWKITQLLHTEEERLVRLVDYLKNRQKRKK